MLFYTVAAKSISSAYGAVIRALSCWESTVWEAGRQVSVWIPQEIFLFKAEPKIIVVVVDGGASVGNVWRTVCVKYFGHYQVGVLTVWVWIDRHWLQ